MHTENPGTEIYIERQTDGEEPAFFVTVSSVLQESPEDAVIPILQVRTLSSKWFSAKSTQGKGH